MSVPAEASNAQMPCGFCMLASNTKYLNCIPLGLFVFAAKRLLDEEIGPSSVSPVERVVTHGNPAASNTPLESLNPWRFLGSPMNCVGLPALEIVASGVHAAE